MQNNCIEFYQIRRRTISHPRISRLAASLPPTLVPPPPLPPSGFLFGCPREPARRHFLLPPARKPIYPPVPPPSNLPLSGSVIVGLRCLQLASQASESRRSPPCSIAGVRGDRSPTRAAPGCAPHAASWSESPPEQTHAGSMREERGSGRGGGGGGGGGCGGCITVHARGGQFHARRRQLHVRSMR